MEKYHIGDNFYYTRSDNNYLQKCVLKSVDIDKHILILKNPLYPTKELHVKEEFVGKTIFLTAEEARFACRQKMPATNVYEKIIRDCNKALEYCNSFLKSHEEIVITEEVFGRRATNALLKAGIKTYGDLANKTAYDLRKIRNLGKESLNKITETCKLLAQEDGIEEPLFKEEDIAPVWQNIYEMTDKLLLAENLSYVETDEKQEKAQFFIVSIRESVKYLINSFSEHSERARDVLIRRLIKGETLQDVGEIHGVTRERIRQIQKKESRKLLSKLQSESLDKTVINRIETTFMSLNQEEYIYCLKSLKQYNSSLWGIVNQIVIRKEFAQELDDFIEQYIVDEKKFVQAQKSAKYKEKKTRKKYWDWVNEYPGYLVLMRFNGFYHAYGKSAEALNEIFGYKLNYSSKAQLPFTGGSNLEKLMAGLEDANINYIVISFGVLIASYDSGEVSGFINEANLNQNHGKDVVRIIDCLEQGIDPETGEIIDTDRFVEKSGLKDFLIGIDC